MTGTLPVTVLAVPERKSRPLVLVIPPVVAEVTFPYDVRSNAPSEIVVASAMVISEAAELAERTG
jgi:hypothetical protein